MKNEILVIDDNADIRFLICNILKEKEYVVRSAANYSQAVNEIEKKFQNKSKQIYQETKIKINELVQKKNAK